MGAWGPRSFENDDAMDWIGEFAERPSVDGLRSAFAATEIRDVLEAPQASAALAAADLLATLRDGKPADAAVAPHVAKIREAGLPVDLDLVRHAVAAVDRVATDSELVELWDDDGDWSLEVATLRERLTGDI